MHNARTPNLEEGVSLMLCACVVELEKMFSFSLFVWVFLGYSAFPLVGHVFYIVFTHVYYHCKHPSHLTKLISSHNIDLLHMFMVIQFFFAISDYSSALIFIFICKCNL